MGMSLLGGIDVTGGITFVSGEPTPPVTSDMELVYSLASPTSITISLSGTLSQPLNAIIDWGDGNTSIANTDNGFLYSHAFDSSGTKNIKVGGSVATFGYDQLVNTNLRSVISWGNLGLTNLNYAFRFSSNVVSVAPPPSTVTNLSFMFLYATLSPSLGLSTWNTSQITTMEGMFRNSNFNENIGSWNTSNVTAMNQMFYTASNFNQNLNSWCVTNIPSYPSLFADDSALNPSNYPVWGTCP